MKTPFKQKHTIKTFPFKEEEKLNINIPNFEKSKFDTSSFGMIKKGGLGEDPRETSGFSTLHVGKVDYSLKSGGSIYGQGTLINKINTKGAGVSESVKAVEVGYQNKKFKLGLELGKVSGSVEDYQFKTPIIPKIKFSVNI